MFTFFLLNYKIIKRAFRLETKDNQPSFIINLFFLTEIYYNFK